MNRLPAILTAAILCLAQAQLQAAEGPAFPGNEALRFVNGKRAVEMPPLTDRQKQARKMFPTARAPTDQSLQAYMLETEAGLMECTSIGLRAGDCRPSSLGKVVMGRLWVVKRDGEWLTCISRKPNARCDRLHGALEGIGQRE